MFWRVVFCFLLTSLWDQKRPNKISATVELIVRIVFFNAAMGRTMRRNMDTHEERERREKEVGTHREQRGPQAK